MNRIAIRSFVTPSFAAATGAAMAADFPAAFGELPVQPVVPNQRGRTARGIGSGKARVNWAHPRRRARRARSHTLPRRTTVRR